MEKSRVYHHIAVLSPQDTDRRPTERMIDDISASELFVGDRSESLFLFYPHRFVSFSFVISIRTVSEHKQPVLLHRL
jgi:hypothetical protein